MDQVRFSQRDRRLLLAIATTLSMTAAGCTNTAPVEVQSENATPGVELEAPKKLYLDPVQNLNGTPYLIAAVQAGQTDRSNILSDSYQTSPSSYSLPSATNYMFVNSNTLKGNRLVPTNQWRFLQSEWLGQGKQNAEVEVVKALWYVVAKADTNGDKQLNESDRKVIALSDAAGKNYTEVISQVDRILGSHRKGNSILQVFYISNGKHLASEVDFLTRKVIRTEPLPAL